MGGRGGGRVLEGRRRGERSRGGGWGWEGLGGGGGGGGSGGARLRSGDVEADVQRRGRCVSQPSEMGSTPASATARTFASVMPPDASVWQRPPTIATAARSCSGAMLSSSTASTPQRAPPRAGRACPPRPRWARPAQRARTRLDRHGDDRRRRAMWLSLMSTASSRPKRWLTPPPTATAYFSSSAQARRRLAGVLDRRARTRDRPHDGRRRSGDAGQPAEKVEIDALGGQQGARRAAERRHGGAGRTSVPSAATMSQPRVPAIATAPSRSRRCRRCAQARGPDHGGHRLPEGTIASVVMSPAAAEVLGERGMHGEGQRLARRAGITRRGSARSSERHDGAATAAELRAARPRRGLRKSCR